MATSMGQVWNLDQIDTSLLWKINRHYLILALFDLTSPILILSSDNGPNLNFGEMATGCGNGESIPDKYEKDKLNVSHLQLSRKTCALKSMNSSSS